jgi:streptogramin lyase
MVRRWGGVWLGLLALCCSESVTMAQEVITVLGTGQAGWSGDGGPGSVAKCGAPFGIVVGPDGALYVCETTSHVIRRIDPETQLVTTVAGTGGKSGSAGDGGPAKQAFLHEPYEVRFDRDGHMFFVEMKGEVVRRVDSRTGIISTVAGNGTAGFSGDGGPATKAQLKQPHSIALDNSGHLYICDIGNHRVRRVDIAQGTIETFGGTGERKPTPDGAAVAGTPLNGPRALDFDGSGALVLALREGNAIYRVDLKTLTYQHLAGTGKSGYSGHGGPAQLAQLAGPKGVSIGLNGDIYFADTESHTIRVIRAESGIVETLVGDGKPGDGPDGDPRKCRLARPHGVYVDGSDNVYIGDSDNHRVRMYRPARP